MLRATAIFSLVSMLNGCQTNPIQSNWLADYRATVISSQLPVELGSLTLVDAQSEANIVTLVFAKKKNLDMDSLVDQVTVSFCDNIELRTLLESRISYQVITLDKNDKVESLNVISLAKCLNE
ncbi:type II secretion system pilot lipoprotein GspS-beta [Vibrio coralliilyticus]|uniref:type II secretion system pilot lipoprotein GspS-beta n=1 Tax=Vibrio coralliilyticus TaxID=190893 RepID=UPI00178E8828|nr:type II secretion system pilot lipoprotein GspS-beta [Vibrio coralliilyticus]NUW67126.1 type II secretion system pilot lipoprotein GspS-beta [Vibrio coralliilyticus]